MKPLKILIPTDFSVQAEFAFLMVKKLGWILQKTWLSRDFLEVSLRRSLLSAVVSLVLRVQPIRFVFALLSSGVIPVMLSVI